MPDEDDIALDIVDDPHDRIDVILQPHIDAVARRISGQGGRVHAMARRLECGHLAAPRRSVEPESGDEDHVHTARVEGTPDEGNRWIRTLPRRRGIQGG